MLKNKIREAICELAVSLFSNLSIGLILLGLGALTLDEAGLARTLTWGVIFVVVGIISVIITVFIRVYLVLIKEN